tara:strand:+ start:1724 stop:2455 length:732 start_codon:yes stop_codon:yes gene_type:complete
MSLLLSKSLNKNFVVLGHRGSPKECLENTIPSFLCALDKSNWQGIELDVQLSKDNKVIIFHDESLNRLAHINLNISDLEYAEINKIRLTGNNRVPLLSDLLKIYPKNKIINIEIKKYKTSNKGIEKKIIYIIKKNNLYDRCIISSFYPQIIKKIKTLDSKVTTALLWTRINFFSKLILSLNLWWSKPDGFHPNINFVDENIIKMVKSKKMFCIAYTVDRAVDLKKVYDLNLNGIVTNNHNLKI